MATGLLFDTINPAPAIADTSRAAFERILPTLSKREIETFLLLCDYCEQTGYDNATGGELAEFAKRPVTHLRPRLTALSEGTKRNPGKNWIRTLPARASRAKDEGMCHPYAPVVPRSAVERARRIA